MSLALNIVAFDVPYPPNYGGVIDVYYKILWLSRAGVKIYLHCFNYGRQQAHELNALCAEVHYYERKTGFASNLSQLPYTVVSRKSEELAQRLLSNPHPILFEVLHTCYLMKDPRFASRQKIYRHSNIEHKYYFGLSRAERNPFRKIYFLIEAWKLKRFESNLGFADLILAVNSKDAEYFRKRFPAIKIHYLPSFHASEKVEISSGKGDFILFHGNLSVSENYRAAVWLVNNVFSKTEHRVVIAGLNPPDFLRKMLSTFPDIELIANPEAAEMDLLLREAQVHVLFTFQPTGLKLKLLNVLFRGRFVVCNSLMLSGTGLHAGGALVQADSAREMLLAIHKLFQTSFSEQLVSDREKQLLQFSNRRNAEELIAASAQ